MAIWAFKSYRISVNFVFSESLSIKVFSWIFYKIIKAQKLLLKIRFQKYFKYGKFCHKTQTEYTSIFRPFTFSSKRILTSFLLHLNIDSKIFTWIPNSFNLKLYGPSYDILNRAQHSGTKQSSLGDTKFCKINLLGYTYPFNMIQEPKLIYS